jgi:hypothetical protein
VGFASLVLGWEDNVGKGPRLFYKVKGRPLAPCLNQFTDGFARETHALRYPVQFFGLIFAAKNAGMIGFNFFYDT